MTLGNSLYSSLLGGAKMYLIKKVSEISGVSVRTLHHYDKIGLLSPKKNKNGYLVSSIVRCESCQYINHMTLIYGRIEKKS